MHSRKRSMVSKIVEQHIPCPVCPSSDAYCTYDDGYGYCFSCNNYQNGDHLSVTIPGEEFSYEYLNGRGISSETFRLYNAKTKIDGRGNPLSIGFPYVGNCTKVRTVKGKEFYWVGQHKPGLFGIDKFAAGSHKYITITEGEYDALSLHQVLRSPCVSVQSSTSAHRDVSLDREYLSSFERIYLAFDNDAAGREA